MDQEFFNWALLLGRWLHITTAMAWIGTSIFFMWLDRSLQNGELWMVHGGGFYRVNKHLMGPTKVPEHLHWFKWESYWTWMSGFFLALLIFYTGSGTFLLDSSVSSLTFWPAVAVGLSSLFISWFFYDFLWESKQTKNHSLLGHFLTLAWFAGMSFTLCHLLSGRAAYLHIGAMLGTWMTANVFLRIIPRQVKMVEASKKGEPVNQEWAKNAKNRSTHNTYFTLPVIFIMLSNHFPMTYGNHWNWVILLVLSAAGAAIRHFFVIRLQNESRARSFLGIGLALILAVVFLSRENSSHEKGGAALPVHSEISAPSGQAIGGIAGGLVNESGAPLEGLVKFEGVLPVMEKLNVPFECSQGHEGDLVSNEIQISAGRSANVHVIKNVLIRITKGLTKELEGRTFTDKPTETVHIDQKHCMYEPRVAAARVGQTVEFINSDAVFHNVRSITKNNEDFNVAMPSKEDRFTKVFTKPEVFLQTKCSVHPWMNAYIAVIDHPFYAVTGASGEFVIRGLPSGKYTLEAWHEVLGTQTQVISFPEDSKVTFTFRH